MPNEPIPYEDQKKFRRLYATKIDESVIDTGVTVEDVLIKDGAIPYLDTAITDGLAGVGLVVDIGVVQKDGDDGTGSDDITHGLGRTPKLVEIHSAWKESSGSVTVCHGMAVATDDEIAMHYSSNTDVINQGTGNVITMNSAGSPETVRWAANITTIDSTKFTIDFTTVQAGEYLYYTWKVIA